MASQNNKKIWISLAVVAVIVIVVIINKYSGGILDSGDKTRTKGPASAKVTIVEFSDFQCPACAKAQPILNEIREEFPGKVRIEFRHFPLGGHRWAKLSHQAAECAASQGDFWNFHDFLFNEQETWSRMDSPLKRFVEVAREQNLDVDKFGACMTDQEVTERIMKDKNKGLEMQVRSTPTFFINGERFVGAKELGTKGKDAIKELL